MRSPRARLIPLRRPWWLTRRRVRSGMRIDDTDIRAMDVTPAGLRVRTWRGVYLVTGRDVLTVRSA